MNNIIYRGRIEYYYSDVSNSLNMYIHDENIIESYVLQFLSPTISLINNIDFHLL